MDSRGRAGRETRFSPVRARAGPETRFLRFTWFFPASLVPPCQRQSCAPSGTLKDSLCYGPWSPPQDLPRTGPIAIEVVLEVIQNPAPFQNRDSISNPALRISRVPPWCLPGCASGSFRPPWCLPGASQAVQLILSCFLGASQAVQIVLSYLPGASLVATRSFRRRKMSWEDDFLY